MKNVSKFWTYMVLSAAVGAAVTSCKSGEIDPPVETGITVVGTLNGDLIHGPIQGVGASKETMSLTWTSGDHIGLFYSPEGYDDAKLVNSDFRLSSVNTEKTEGTFTSTTEFLWHYAAASHEFYAVYPYSASNTNLSAIEVNIPTQITLAEGDLFPETFVVGSAVANEIPESGEVEMVFTTPLAFVKVVVDAEGSLINGENVTAAGISAAVNIAGTATYDVLTSTLSDFDAQEILFDYAGGIALDGSVELYFAVNPNADLTSAAANLELAIEGATFNATFDLTLESSLQAGKISVINLNVEEAVAGGKGTIELDGEISTDIANSYIVAPGGRIIIPVKQAYNAWSGTHLNSPIAAGVTLTTELLWQDAVGAVSGISMFKATDGENAGIYIKTGTASGNALIALKADGATIWSWHIWVTDYDPNVTAGQNVLPGNGDSQHVWMNRNLGATSITPGDLKSHGLAYQWGRKDPFPRSNGERQPSMVVKNEWGVIYDIAGNELTIGETGTGVKTGPQPESDAVAGLRYAVRNPNMNFFGSTLWFSSTWNSTPTSMPITMTLWGCTDFRTRTDVGKSVFDPCPKGWRVPNDATITAKLTTATKTNIPEQGYDFGDLGYFPNSGYISGGAWQEVTYGSGLWFNWQAGLGGLSVEFRPDEVRGGSNSTQFTGGFNVRCEQEW